MANINKILASLLPLGVLMFSACAMQPPTSLMDIQAGEVFVLKTPITIQPNQSRTFIQFGQITGSSFDHSEAHCRIEIRNLSELPQVIQPERFIIKQVNIDEEMIALRNQTTQLALNDAITPTTMTDSTSINMVAYERPATMDLVHLYLHSKQQPNVYRLTCSSSLSNGSLADIPRSYRPQRQQIQHILGKIGHIESGT